MSLINFDKAIIKTSWIFGKKIFISDLKKEYIGSYYDVSYNDVLNYNINKFVFIQCESYLKQDLESYDKTNNLLIYKFIKNKGYPSRNNNIVSNSLFDEVCYELLKVNEKEEEYIYAWNTIIMTDKEAKELTYAFLN